MKHKYKTSVGGGLYIVLFVVSFLFIVLKVYFVSLENTGTLLCDSLTTTVDILANGFFPSVFLAWLTDIVANKRQYERYNVYYKNISKNLKNLCEELASLLYVCVIDVYTRNNCLKDNLDRKETFSSWCKILFDSNDENQIEQFMQCLNDIKKEAENLLNIINSFDAFNNEEKRIEQSKKVSNLIFACNRFYLISEIGGKKVHIYKYNSNLLTKAITDLFLENEIQRIYTEPYNSEDNL